MKTVLQRSQWESFFAVSKADYNDTPGIAGSVFKFVILNKDIVFGDVVQNYYKQQFVVIDEPWRKKWQLLIQCITFGLYKAPWRYALAPTAEKSKSINDANKSEGTEPSVGLNS